jgi:hypothetical protein
MADALQEAHVARHGGPETNFRAQDIEAGASFRRDYEGRLNVVPAEEMPFEKCADGLIKHLVHHKMNTRECCIEAYMQFLDANGKSGRHRHMWEEVLFVTEGSGYDLHWDLKFDCLDAFEWKWEATPRRFEWKRGDFIYVPPYSEHQHFAGAEGARMIVISNRMVKEMGFNWFEQVEAAPEA